MASPAEGIGPPRPVPMFVEMIDSVRHRRREMQRAGDVGTAGAARKDQFLRDRIAILEDRADRGGAAMQRRGGGGARGDEVDGRGEAGANRLVALLEGEIVGLIQFADPRGIAAAAEILEQQGIIEIVAILRRQAERATDVAADPAGADAMAGRLSLGQVERIAERRHQLRQSDGGGPGSNSDRRILHKTVPSTADRYRQLVNVRLGDMLNEAC